MTTAITVQERASVALKSPAAEKALRALVAGTIDIGAPTNRAGREQCHAAAMAALKARTEIVSAGKAARAVVNVLQEGMLQAICKLRGIGDYGEADKKMRAMLRIELFQDLHKP